MGFTIFLILAVASLIVLIVGFILLMTSRGETTRRSGREVGAEIMGSLGEEETEGVSIPVLEKSVFVGTGVSVTRETEMSYAEVKQLIRDRQWRAALPPLLVIAGMFGLIVFGVVALWLKMDDKLIATLIAAVVLFTMGRIALGFIRA